MKNRSEAIPFRDRHIGISAANIGRMLKELGFADMAAFVAKALPADIRQREPLALGRGLSEAELLAKVRLLASANKALTSMIGQGYYDTFTPPVILRNIVENPAWYTAYTPYQPEISQGRLEALLNFQTMIADLTGLPIANASLLDEATAAAEAMSMARRICQADRNAFFVDDDCHPQTIAVIRTRAEPLGWQVVVGNPETDLDPNAVFGAIVQYPGSSGKVRDFRRLIAGLHAAGTVAVMAADPLALTLLASPGELGADIAVGSTQRFGVPLGFGGPHAAYIATEKSHERLLPGRLVGVTVDRDGRQAIRLALQTREQHIRREKATSNICTAQVLLAIVAAMYAVYHGPDGLRQIARAVAGKAAVLAQGLKRLGHELAHAEFFDTVAVKSRGDHDEILRRARDLGVNLRSFSWRGATFIGISCDETTTAATIETVWRAFNPGHDNNAPFSYEALAEEAGTNIPASLARHSEFLTHPVFHRYRSETEMLRYLRRLADMDLALDRTMIPLGSCTMKLNATAEMMPLTWPEFGRIHPYVPADQVVGYQWLVQDLEKKLCAITGYDAFSFQPNSGAQGEYAGLLAIRAYHRARGDTQRNVCLIPTSAHGTNPASAQMAGMKVVAVKCDAHGNVDLADLEAKAGQHAGDLAAVMVTYPSTHGVFETAIRRICEIVHAKGGQVYLDGANLNAQVGLARPGDYGGDVSHINLHKTFCIPHGGGGPGMGPIGVKAHLVPFLPGDPNVTPAQKPSGAVSAARFGSASILTISWIYMELMGGEGLTAATEAAILSANYIAKRLEKHYPLLFKEADGLVAHECILDVRPFKATAGISVEDVAKRLIDYGFHAPTMSFPVAGTLMIEPTESESLAELDRFCDAMIAIRGEIRDIEEGKLDRRDNPLVNAPHTIGETTADEWKHGYSRELAAFPLPSLRQGKYWAPVCRVDNVYGDRNLVCSCPPMEAYVDEKAGADMVA
jgi:glycine dehydrogenase